MSNLGALIRSKVEEKEQDALEAARWRWWKNHMKVHHEGKWIRWMEIDMIPFRTTIGDVDEFTDLLIERFSNGPTPVIMKKEGE
jgi:hypothetical protein